MKPKKQSNGSGEQLDEVLTKLLTLYKRKCEGFGIAPNLTFKQILEKSIQSLKFQEIKTAQPLGPIQIRTLMQSLMDVKYARIKHIDVWKGKIGDQGLRNICRYLQSRQTNVVQVLDLLQNQISSLGCQFLGKVFTLPFTKIKKLKLDDNLIGTKGLESLAIGLRTNDVLTKLSLKYCGIDEKGVRYLQDILANLSSKIRSIKIQGNPLGNKGIYQFLKVVQLNEMLQKVNIADTKLNLLDFVAKNLYVIDQNYVEEQNEQQQGDEQNPEKKQIQPPQLSSVKEVIIPDSSKMEKKESEEKQKQKVAVIKQVKDQKKKSHFKITKTINQQDQSLSADIVRKLSGIMRQNLLIRKYDLRFNPISDDAAIILFEIIQQNIQIKDVQLNNNVDNALRQNLDTLMRKRTGRMPKGGGRKGKSKKTKKKKK